MATKLISNNSYYRETFIYFFLLVSLLSILINNLSFNLYVSRDIFSIPLKIITILSIFIYFFWFDKLKKNYRENIFISFVLSCFLMSILSKINYEFNFNTLLYYFKFFFLFISCFFIYYVFKNLNLKKDYLNTIIIFFNLLSFFFILTLNYNKFKQHLPNEFLSDNLNSKFLIIFFSFYLNLICIYKKKNFIIKSILILLTFFYIYYIFNYTNIYTKLITLFSITLFFLNYIFNKKTFFNTIKIIYFFLLVFLIIFIILSFSKNLINFNYFFYFNFIKFIANFANWAPADVCWESTIILTAEEKADSINLLLKNYPINCWNLENSFIQINSFLLDLWSSVLLRSHYWTETLSSLRFNEILFGRQNPNILFSYGIFPHNSFIDIFAKFGIFFLILTSVFIFYVFKNFLKKENFFGLVFLYVIIFSMSLDDYLFGHRYEMTVIIWILIGIFSNKNFKKLEI